MAIQTTLTPINGKEAKQLIDIQLKRILDQIPGLDMATSYHRLTISGTVVLTAYPADTPTPKIEFAFNIDSPQTRNGDNKDHLDKIKYLETVRDELMDRLNKITEELDKSSPVMEGSFNLEAGDQPDILRIENGLSIPVVEKSGGRNVETYKQVNIDKGKLQFGKKS